MTLKRDASRILIAALVWEVASIACAGSAGGWPRYVQPLPDAPPPDTAYVSTQTPKPMDYVLGTPIQGTHFGVVGARGSLGLGLLFGPIGVAANVAAVSAKNEKRGNALASLTQTDLVQLLKDVRHDSMTSDVTDNRYGLMPMAQLRFDDDTQFHIGCMVRAALSAGKKQLWYARYFVEMPGSFDSQSEASLADAKETLAPCLTEANRLFEAHVKGGMKPSDTLRPVLIFGKLIKEPVVEAELPSRIVVSDAAGLTEYPVE